MDIILVIMHFWIDKYNNNIYDSYEKNFQTIFRYRFIIVFIDNILIYSRDEAKTH